MCKVFRVTTFLCNLRFPYAFSESLGSVEYFYVFGFFWTWGSLPCLRLKHAVSSLWYFVVRPFIRHVGGGLALPVVVWAWIVVERERDDRCRKQRQLFVTPLDDYDIDVIYFFLSLYFGVVFSCLFFGAYNVMSIRWRLMNQNNVTFEGKFHTVTGYLARSNHSKGRNLIFYPKKSLF